MGRWLFGATDGITKVIRRSFTRRGLSNADRYRFIAELEAAAMELSAPKPSLQSTAEAGGTWTVLGLLEGEPSVLDALASRHFLGLPLSDNA